MDSSHLVLDDEFDEDNTSSSTLSRTDLVKAAKHQSPRTAEPGKVAALTLERRGIRSISRGAFLGFPYLIELNLSRNELTTLRGIESAISLETLSLYYNRVAYLEELRHLIPLKKLERLDLRLNPVTRDEAYRSYVIFHIPNLQELDERSVRPAERRHAQLAVEELDVQYHNPPDTDEDEGAGNDSDNDNGTPKYDTKRQDATIGDEKKTSIEIIQDYQQSVQHVKHLNLRQRHRQRSDAQDAEQEQVLNPFTETPTPPHTATTTATTTATSPTPFQPQVNNSHLLAMGGSQEQYQPQYQSQRQNDNNYSNLSSAPSIPIQTTTTHQIDQLLNAAATAIASVQLPQQLTLSSVTLIHMPDLVARACRPALRHVLTNFINENNVSIQSEGATRMEHCS